MSWVIVITFLFPGQAAIFQSWSCPTQRCVDDAVRRADADPAVVHYQVLGKGEPQAKVSGVPMFRPLVDVRKQ